uniref:LisH domain-containing protein n=1 Tax=Parastrongyloides trichosuri TaxID=131310 RepID=A0A0N4Z9L8_PARTI
MANVKKEVDDLLNNLSTDTDSLHTALGEFRKVSNNLISNLERLIDENILKNEKNGTNKVDNAVKHSLESFSDIITRAINRQVEDHKDMHQDISKLGKIIDKHFVDDYNGLLVNQEDVYEDKEMAEGINQLVHEHLLSTGDIDAAELMTKEVKFEPNGPNYSELYHVESIANDICKREIEKALNYLVDKHKEEKELIRDFKRILALQYVEKGNKSEALTLTKEIAALSSPEEIGHVKELMTGIMSYPNCKNWECLQNKEIYQDLACRFAKVAVGLPEPLQTVVETGSSLLPTFMNTRELMKTRGRNISEANELPIDAADQEEPQHSVFVCPVLKSASDISNPPVRLTCGHVVAKDALERMAVTNRANRIKCIYCPKESLKDDAKVLYFC